MIYDDNNLYFGIYLFDNPSKIKGKISQYDEWDIGFKENYWSNF